MSTPFHLTHKTILVTGASSGIGRQVAISCSAMGAKIIVVGRNAERLDETYKQLKGEGHTKIVCDLRKEKELATLAESLPQLDGIVNSAGIVMPVPAKFTEEKHLKEVMGTNFDTAVLLTGRLLKAKRINDKASLVFISSVASGYPYNGSALYSASKGAIEAYSKNLALELHGKQIRSNCIVPAMVNTNIYQDTVKHGMHGSNADEYKNKYLLGIGEPEDIANASVYLLSDAAKWVTGTSLVIDGGYSILK
jgi:NAD(P)-dependent dehydrogenase (short-subunit alcohol dehydrogenase family)